MSLKWLTNEIESNQDSIDTCSWSAKHHCKYSDVHNIVQRVPCWKPCVVDVKHPLDEGQCTWFNFALRFSCLTHNFIPSLFKRLLVAHLRFFVWSSHIWMFFRKIKATRIELWQSMQVFRGHGNSAARLSKLFKWHGTFTAYAVEMYSSSKSLTSYNCLSR